MIKREKLGTRQIVPNWLRTPNPTFFFEMLLINFDKGLKKCLINFFFIATLKEENNFFYFTFLKVAPEKMLFLGLLKI